MSHEEEIENARVGYQVATNLWIYEGEIFWSKFNAMLLANSILLGSIALSLTASRSLPLFTFGLPFIGIILCIVWFQTTNRSFDFYSYWIFSARELEEQYLSNSVKTVSRGGGFAEGNEIRIKIGDEMKSFKISRLSRLLRVKWASHLITLLFVVMYLAFLLTNIVGLLVIPLN